MERIQLTAPASNLIENSQLQHTPRFSVSHNLTQPAPSANLLAASTWYTSPVVPSAPRAQPAFSRRDWLHEEEKQQRNTASSARFREKKKQRERALEQKFKEISDKNTQLEVQISQLEMHNKWLKDLILEKAEDQSKPEMRAVVQKLQETVEDWESKKQEEKDLALIKDGEIHDHGVE